MKNIVLNIPHAATNGVFDPVYGKWEYNQHFVNDCVNKWTDWYVDFLFYGLARCEGTKTIAFPYSRFVCDAEQPEDTGEGMICREFGGYKRRALDEEAMLFLKKVWADHQDNLRSALNEDSVLIDCRTFPSDMADCDICIGYNDDWSYDKDIVDGVIGIFEDRGYKVSINEPYGNFIVPRTAFDYPAIMIGVNKRVYLNERILQLERDNKKWIRWNGTLEKINDFLRKR